MPKNQEKKKDISRGNITMPIKSKRILLAMEFYPPDIGGQATYAKQLKEGLAKVSHDKIKAITLNFGEVRSWPPFLNQIIYFFKALNRGRYCQIMYALEPATIGLVVYLTARLLRKPFWLRLSFPPATDKAFSAKLSRFIIRRADLILVTNTELKKNIEALVVKPCPIILDSNIFDLPEEMESKKKIREKWGVETLVIVAAGQLVSRKRFDAIIEALPAVLQRYPGTKLLIAGAGPEQERLKNKITSLDLADNVMLAGLLSREDLLVYLRLADVFVSADPLTTSGQTILEATVLGTPVVTAENGLAHDLAKAGANIAFVSPDNNTTLADAIIKQLSDKYKPATTTSSFHPSRTGDEMIVDLIRLVLRI